ncbi:MAG TPA: prepilin-type cleavage/methylation domain-containing protein [Pseudomonas sp.]|jgi:MSHA pilin protein MshD|uniref:prepilin-type N-terminal cleavage/methylation domain-containing protein n=1 Tax=Stutzerimonas xanthomarina TaxID=271420 RepID=UPI000E9D05EF|nr:prepilin-type N-terminal cleavage/methylation domain-containing protein [Stutzerimonas xanthomarina]MBU0851852.1 prepilin-type N-terminal cleavage/methylation domain-containing protein [Gammaproteobacteria bacterium]HAQ85910.1 prepilin-type cleavage/methylation domain-containing protein [Pseudomonas sp.]MBK3847224.1 prepilin-type N-terminal cleavage/methylation domain-containing protein [Stutzerimonas xanthomarina]MBU1773356.1 prepilin-type N-terminal cleavage/methylation domain-containing p|tara:strand:- start:842 stop:1315 length:474 start_codon:yes stop_codon:yes gene_type:complete
MKRQRGMTLVELVITIVIIGIAAAALFTAMASITARSADPLLRQQSLAIAEAYLEEIELQAFATQANAACSPARACFNDVRDYAGISEAPHDAFGTAIADLAAYNVAVTVNGPDAWSGVQALHVDVRVTDPAGATLQLSGYRTCYGETDTSGASLCP